MAIGDLAAAAGFALVPNSGLVRDGAQEINRTRDYVAEVKTQVPGTKAEFRAAGGFSSGTGNPTGGQDGDVYFKIV